LVLLPLDLVELLGGIDIGGIVSDVEMLEIQVEE
jgi:hypothetical protein